MQRRGTIRVEAVNLVILLGISLISAMLAAQTGALYGTETANNHAAADIPRSEGVTTNGLDYVIGPDDVLRISVWKEPDLSETIPVRPDGKISMPLLNDVRAAGMTPLHLKDSITEKLKKYVSDPRVTVIVTAMNSQRVFITGEVQHSGPIQLLPNMTVLQALSQAGFTEFANLKAIYVLRTDNGRHEKLPFNYKEMVKGNHPEQNIPLKPGDTLVVP